MDAAGIDMHVLPTAQPGLEHIEAARAIPCGSLIGAPTACSKFELSHAKVTVRLVPARTLG